MNIKQLTSFAVLFFLVNHNTREPRRDKRGRQADSFVQCAFASFPAAIISRRKASNGMFQIWVIGEREVATFRYLGLALRENEGKSIDGYPSSFQMKGISKSKIGKVYIYYP